MGLITALGQTGGLNYCIGPDPVDLITALGQTGGLNYCTGPDGWA